MKCNVDSTYPDWVIERFGEDDIPDWAMERWGNDDNTDEDYDDE